MAQHGGLDCTWALEPGKTEFKSQAFHIIGVLAWAVLIFKAPFAHHKNGNNAYITALLYGLKEIMYERYRVWLL